ncbi:hypothetical protein OG21DRAFT_1520645 [Imleria badia]|nr:hypothetical protein OG21DRAFT_1520645 [Imleria badia]
MSKCRKTQRTLSLNFGCCIWIVPSESVIDVRRNFLDLDYELYDDLDTCPVPLFVAEIFDLSPCTFPQQADEGMQEVIARPLATLLHGTEGNGPAVLFCRTVAKAEKDVIDNAMGRTRYGHFTSVLDKVVGAGDSVLDVKTRMRVRVDTEFLRVEQTRDWKGRCNPGRGTDMIWWVWPKVCLDSEYARCYSGPCLGVQNAQDPSPSVFWFESAHHFC